MNEIKVFENKDFGKVQAIELDGEWRFELYSIGMALGQVKEAKGNLYPRKERINENVKKAEIKPVVHNGQLWITEPEMYDLMFETHTERVKPFKKWVTSEILPSIRRHGIYATDNVIDEILNNPDFGIELLTKLKEERQEKEKERQARIQAEQKNQQLNTDNKALSGKLLDWADRDRINAGIRKLAAATGIRFGDMYKELYKNIEYSHKIYLKSRMERDKNKKKNASYLDYVRDNEWIKILKTFCAMCEAYGKSPKDMMQQTTPKSELSVADDCNADDKYAWLDNM